METKTEKSAPDTVTVTVNGKEMALPKGQNLLKALLDSGNNVPHYCWHPSLSIAGNCRLCMVEIEGQPRPSVSCNMTCTEGLKIKTDSEMVLDARKGMMEFLLQNHPLDCPICDRGGECMLQRYSMQHGTGTARTVDTRRRFQKPEFDPLIDIERNRCIMCTRCVRFMDEEAGKHVLGVFGRGDRNYIGTEGNGPVSSIFSGNIIDLCPVGCLTSKPFRFKARPWEMQQVNSTCTLCSAGCETTAWIRDGQVLRVTPPVRKYGQQFTIDEDTTRFICNEGRFGNMYANSPDRLRKAQVRRGGALETVALKNALEAAAEALKGAAAAGPDKVAILAGTRATNEEYYLLSRLARTALGTNQLDWRLDYATAEAAQAAGLALGASDGDLALLEQKAYAATLFVGSDLQDTVPVTGLKLRDAARRRQTRLFVVGSRLDGWLSPHAEAASIVKPDAVGKLLLDVAAHAGGKKSRKQDVADLATGIAAAKTGLLVLLLDEAGGAYAADRVGAALELLRQLGEGWKFLPVFHGRNAKGAFAAGAQADRLPAGDAGAEAPRNLMAELWGAVKAKPEGGPTAIEILERAAAGEIRTLLLHRADALVHHPRRALIEKALEATSTVIAIDVYPSWITERATIVLPGALFHEVEGTLVSADGTIHALMQANLAPGDAQEDWRILDSLSAALGVASRYAKAADIFADLARCWGAPARTRLQDFWLEGPGFESPQRPQPAVIRKKSRPDFKLHFGSRAGEVPRAKAEGKAAAGLRLLYVTGIQGADHLASRSAEFAELRPERTLEMNPKDMKKLKLAEGAAVRARPGSHVMRLVANDSLPAGIVYAASNVLGLEWDGGEDLPAIELEPAVGVE